MSLANVQSDQAGKYTCVATQKLDNLKNTQEREIELIVECKQKLFELKAHFEHFFVDGPKQKSEETIEVNASIGETLNLRCDVESEPKSRYSWLRNNYEIYDDIDIHTYYSFLKVTIKSPEDLNDNYTCVAQNEHGRASQNFVLKEHSLVLDTNDARRTAEISTLLMILIATYMAL